MIPEGKYQGVALDWRIDKFENGTSFFGLKVKFTQLLNEETDEFEERADGPIIRELKLWLNNAANFEKAKKSLRDIGVVFTSFKELDPSNPKGVDFAGKTIVARCRHGEDNKKRPQENWFLAKATDKSDDAAVEDLIASLDKEYAMLLAGDKKDAAVNF